MMRDLRRVEGFGVALRLVEPADAGYIHGLRTDSAYNAHLSSVTGTAEDQRAWIERYKEREAAGLEYYYVIERLGSGRPCGTVRLYEIEGESLTLGSWILDRNKPHKAALESAFMTFCIGFDVLQRETARIDVRKQNTHAQSIYRGFGMIETHRTEKDIYFHYARNRFEADRAGYLQVLTRERAVNPGSVNMGPRVVRGGDRTALPDNVRLDAAPAPSEGS